MRQEIVWAKGAPMPENVTDRCTRSTETIFMFTKSHKYYYDALAIAEPAVSDHGSGNGYAREERLSYRDSAGARGNLKPWAPGGMRNRRNVWRVKGEASPGGHIARFPSGLVELIVKAGCPAGEVVLDPFAGSGTTGEVAGRLGRDFVGIDLSLEYLDLAYDRIDAARLPLFDEPVVRASAS